MDNLSNSDYEQLMNLIDNLIEKRVFEILDNYNIESTSFGIVTSIKEEDVERDLNNNIVKVNKASVETSDGSVVSRILNVSGDILSVGDKVKIFGSRTNLSNRYIGIKY